MRKIGLSLVLVGILGATNAVAEESGAFVGIGGNTNFNSIINKQSQKDANGKKVENSDLKNTTKSNTIGILAGYKYFFIPEFGVRAYGAFNWQNNISKSSGSQDDKTTSNIYAINANADALYNFLSNEALDFGVFAGVSLGYLANNMKYTAPDESTTTKINGFDAAINAGLRTTIAQKHSLELYSRFTLTEQKKEQKDDEDNAGSPSTTYKFKQPYQIGLRYTFSF